MILTESDVRARLSSTLPSWTWEDGAILRAYRFKDFQGALAAANAIGFLAEAAWHHPDLEVSFGALRVRLRTHDAGGVTEKDVALATKIENLLEGRASDGALA